MSKEPLPYRVDPAIKRGRRRKDIFVRAMEGERWINADIAWLDTDSLVRFLVAEPTRAVQVCAMLFGRDLSETVLAPYFAASAPAPQHVPLELATRIANAAQHCKSCRDCGDGPCCDQCDVDAACAALTAAGAEVTRR